jgi:antitoxin component of MazEF toxin-antitoxin module
MKEKFEVRKVANVGGCPAIFIPKFMLRGMGVGLGEYVVIELDKRELHIRPLRVNQDKRTTPKVDQA